MDEQNLPGHVPLEQPPHLPFPNHVHHFVTLDGPAGSAEGPEPLLGIHPALHRSVVLLDDVILSCQKSFGHTFGNSCCFQCAQIYSTGFDSGA